MPSNEQRRAAAKRKLERQLARRAERARRRKQLTIAGSVLGVVAVVAAAATVFALTRGQDSASTAIDDGASTAIDDGASTAIDNASVVDDDDATAACSYDDGGAPPARPVTKPQADGIPTTGINATVSVSMETNRGPLGLTLNNAESPCTVNNFISLAAQNYFDGTDCHRMTASETLKVLQCGDPTGTGTGGPGYVFGNEYPTDRYAPGDPAAMQPSNLYKRGVLAMANAGPGTNGSQFFIMYADSQLPPQYTIFGTVDENSLATLDTIAQLGQDNSAQPGDGRPNQPVTIQSVLVDR
ncbi:peptidylprolyl isomerase [Nocardia sp. CNY236]|uniref:peptidylprolyl isomerase n=1 Tax=Nocardia sp. CNY236 TaxID=1169152 RepID=UPI0003F90EF0|nr:peptidylprolyl isomerase [Nocardia sp. CNY236]